ncbi:uncharacterized protein [Montipora foliosa]|uniref:uncharacterized protein isoform X2 n=1 Tax=Montipora foliosa TaxID=591990 RepID=UPI0035F19C02
MWKRAAVFFFILSLGSASQVHPVCTQTLNAENGVFQSPNYPYSYPNDQHCSWSITVKESQKVFLMFSSFSVEDKNNTDAVFVYDGGNTSAKMLGVYYGGHLPPKEGLFSSSNQMLVIFISDSNTSFSGFQASYHAVHCFDPLGMENGAISDPQLSASSQWDGDHAPNLARLNIKEKWPKRGAWSSRTNNGNQWLQVDLNDITTVTRLATQGRNVRRSFFNQWVTRYKLRFSIDGVIFQDYKQSENSSAKVFDGNKDRDTIVYHMLKPAITARFVRILPVAWNGHISMRIELYGCLGCSSALGMERGEIHDSQITASSQWDESHAAKLARLHNSGTFVNSWATRTNDANQWLQVDLGKISTFTGVATQGGKSGRHRQWVTKYRIQYSDNGVNFHFYKTQRDTSPKLFDGNSDPDSVKYNRLNPSFTARYIRLLPVTWQRHISMRIELYGCRGCMTPLGMESKTILDAQISASSKFDDNHSAAQARLYFKANGSRAGGWSPLKDDLNQWIQVDLGSTTRITRVATQGLHASKEWVIKYKMQYSFDGVTFQNFEEVDSSAKVFDGNKNSDTVVYNDLTPIITARFIRFLPWQWNNRIAMRIEIFGCPDCISPLGMESGIIYDDQISASSQMDDNSAASRARLDMKKDGVKQGGWVALQNDLSQWLQVDLGSYTTITRLATQGRDEYDMWVTKYTLQYSYDGVTYLIYKQRGTRSKKVFDGNQNSDSVVYNKLSPSITTRSVRVLPLEWHIHISLRMELYGCQGCIAPLGMESRAITDSQITASTEWDANHTASHARLNIKLTGSLRGGWSARVMDYKQWLQVDLIDYTIVTRVATQGRNGHDQWLTKFRLLYSDDGVVFHLYKERGDTSPKVFTGNVDVDSIVYNNLKQPITTRYVRIQPVAWRAGISLRLEIYGCPACITPLGMESEAIHNFQISASSQMDGKHSAAHARLYFEEDGTAAGGWSALSNDLKQWLQVDLRTYYRITGVATQGRNSHQEWITKYKIDYSDDGVKFKYYVEPGQISAKVYDGNQDSDSVVSNKLTPPITARFLRILPIEWEKHISVRMEIYGCPACTAPLGMESEAIFDEQISASSQWDNDHSAQQARLHSKISQTKRGGWIALKADLKQWLQVDLRAYTRITRVATQGRNAFNQWVTRYRVQYSDDGEMFEFFKKASNGSAWVFDGNKDSDTVVYNSLNPPIVARHIRIQPVEWHGQISMRMELYGCSGCAEPIGMESKAIPDSQITASSEWDQKLSGAQARLHSKSGNLLGGWVAFTNNLHQWLQVDLGSYTTVTRVATQGRFKHNQWVTKYRLEYSDDADIFHVFKPEGANIPKVFHANEDNDTVVYNALSPSITARFIRFVPVEWHNDIAMRVEIYGCPACIRPLGMISGAISDIQITSSSQLDEDHSSTRARLHLKAFDNKSSGWSPVKSDHNQWLQVDLDGSARITRLATQGSNAKDEWVTKYMLEYSYDGVRFHTYRESVEETSAKIFVGNRDSDTVVYNKLIPPITASVLRLFPVEWHKRVTIRMEIYGCQGCVAPLGMESGAITDSQITGSSQWGSAYAPRQGRLQFKNTNRKVGSWSSGKNDLNQWLRIDLGSYTTVTGLATQGRHGLDPYDQYVTAYRLQYSNDGIVFHFYKEPGRTSPKVFSGNTDRDSIVHNRINPSIKARYITLRPTAWNKHISMRMELYGCAGCTEPLGLEDNDIFDVQLSASSQWNENHSPQHGRLRMKAKANSGGCWSALSSDFHQWLQVDLGSDSTVTRVATQGSNEDDQWVSKYRLQYSLSGIKFKFCKRRKSSVAKVFDGNVDRNTIVLNKLTQSINTRFVRFLPVEWHNRISMRVEVYGCPACVTPLGMESEEIAASQISASTVRDSNSPARLARLNLKAEGNIPGCWSAMTNDLDQWLQVDLLDYITVTRVATQGRNGRKEWVAKYKIGYSDDGAKFEICRDSEATTPKVFDGNKDSNTVVYNRLHPPVTARYIRLMPVKWYGHISMRMELYGCPGCASALGMETKEIPDAQINASSQLDEDNAPGQARLHLKRIGDKQGGWSALTNDFNQWLLVDLGSLTMVTRVATQGKNGFDQWVSRYRLQYSIDGAQYSYITKSANSSAQVFYGNKDSETVVYGILTPPVLTRFIRILPVEWHNHVSVRLELYGCTASVAMTTARPLWSTITTVAVTSSNETEMTSIPMTDVTPKEPRSAKNHEKGFKGKGSSVEVIVTPVLVCIFIAVIILAVYFYRKRSNSNDSVDSEVKF